MNISKNLLQKTFRLKNGPKSIGSLKLANAQEDGPRFEKLCMELESGDRAPEHMVLATGLGLPANTSDIPVRLPALILPGLNILRQLKELGVSVPRYEIYQATDFIAETNGLSSTYAKTMAKRMEEYIRNFVDAFSPDIADRVILEFDEDLYARGPVREPIERISEQIREKAELIPEITDIMISLSSSEEKHSNCSGKHDLYAAANLVYNGFGEGSLSAYDLIIGSRSERPFFSLQKFFQDAVRDVFAMYTQLGSRPTYYPYHDKGDPVNPEEYTRAFEVAFKSVMDGPIRKDLEALRESGLTPDALKEIYF